MDWVGLGWTESDLSDRWDGSDLVGVSQWWQEAAPEPRTPGLAADSALAGLDTGVFHWGPPDLPGLGAADGRVPLDAPALHTLLADVDALTGAAGHQVGELARRVGAIVERHPEAAKYVPEPIL